MSHARRILDLLDQKLEQSSTLVLYGRAALALGFTPPPVGAEASRDIDVVLWRGQAEDLLKQGNLRAAIDAVNRELAAENLYVSHFVEEDQVILRPNWIDHIRPIPGDRAHLRLFRLADEDLLLSKLMRDDPLDRSDALFLVRRNKWSSQDVNRLLEDARIPDVAEVREQFVVCRRRLLEAMCSDGEGRGAVGEGS